MNGKRFLALLVACAFGGMAAVTAAAEMPPYAQREITEKPRIEDYADYNAFLVDIMEYRRQKENADYRARVKAQAQAQAAAHPGLASPTGEQPRVTIDAYGRVVIATDPSLYRIQGPESLDEALKRARLLPHPYYSEAERFGRSTSFSFPLPPMEGDDLSTSEVEGELADLESFDVTVYEDEGAPEMAATFLAENPSNEDEAREEYAFSINNGFYEPEVDLNAQTADDSYGRHVLLPLIIRNEVDFTVLRLTNLTVEIR